MSVNKVCLSFLLFLICFEAKSEELCPKQNEEIASGGKKCIWVEPNKPSLIVKGSNGRLGNVLFTYLLLLGTKIKYGSQVFIPRSKRNLLTGIFENLEIPEAEEEICNFEQDYTAYWESYYEAKINKIADAIREKTGNPNMEFERGPTGKLIVQPEFFHDPKYGIDRIVHQKDFASDIQKVIAEPWIINTSPNITDLEKDDLLVGKAILLTSDSAYLNEINELPNIAERMEQNLVFKKKVADMAKNTMNKITEAHLAKLNKAKKKSKKRKTNLTGTDLVYVGIHVRRGDHISYEIEHKVPTLKPSYFLEAMDMYRAFYGGNVLFVLISDEISWALQNLSQKYKKHQDLYFVSEQTMPIEEGIGHDLAVMSLCNHTIISRGTFSYWSSFLAGGSTIMPCHFPQYRSLGLDVASQCIRNPLKKPLPRLFSYTE